MIKIALTARMRAGKDSVAEYLVDKHSFTKFALGDGVRAVSQLAFGGEHSGKKDRAMLQFVGQSMREFNEDVWVNYLMSDIEKAMKPNWVSGKLLKNIVVSDLRQRNEYDRLKSEGYTIVKIHTNENVRLDRIKMTGDIFLESQLSHETENSVDDIPYDLIVPNNGTKEQLHKKIDKLIEYLES